MYFGTYGTENRKYLAEYLKKRYNTTGISISHALPAPTKTNTKPTIRINYE
jgi:hypothetical protein